MINLIKPHIVLFVLCFMYLENMAQSTPKISIQGVLKDANGIDVIDGTYTVTFRLYHQLTGGPILWSEEAPIDVAGGIYTHFLGSIIPLNSSNFSSTLYLGVKVGAYELSPRTELTYAPYALAVLETVCSGAVGDIKYSILNPSQFAAVNGACWVPMDGRSVAGSKLNIAFGFNNLPDGGGLFIRSQEFSSGVNNDPDRNNTSPIGTFQDQAYQIHNHTVNDPGHSHNFSDKFASTTGSCYDISGGRTYPDPNTLTSTPNNTNSSFSGISINNSTGSETRPKNMNFWIYTRIN